MRARPGNRRSAPYAMAAAFLAAALLGGCAALPLQPPAPSSRYVLELPQPAHPVFDAQGPTLLIERPVAAAGYASADMLYLRRPHQLEQFAQHRWADAPAQLLQPLLTASAEASGLFRAVSDGRGRADLRLETELVQLRQEFLQTPSQVRLAVRVRLLDGRSGEALAGRLFELREPAAEDTPYGGVLAANRAVARLLSGLQDFLRTVVAGHWRPGAASRPGEGA